jgi:hypothetical protein
VAVLEVTGEPYLAEEGEDRIWQMDLFPARLPVRVEREVDPLHGPLVEPMLDDLEAAKKLTNRKRWGTLFMGSSRGWPDSDGRLIEDALRRAHENPVEHELPSSAFRSHGSEVVKPGCTEMRR